MPSRFARDPDRIRRRYVREQRAAFRRVPPASSDISSNRARAARPANAFALQVVRDLDASSFSVLSRMRSTAGALASWTLNCCSSPLSTLRLLMRMRNSPMPISPEHAVDHARDLGFRQVAELVAADDVDVALVELAEPSLARLRRSRRARPAGSGSAGTERRARARASPRSAPAEPSGRSAARPWSPPRRRPRRPPGATARRSPSPRRPSRSAPPCARPSGVSIGRKP